jgi:hypothetical protein
VAIYSELDSTTKSTRLVIHKGCGALQVTFTVFLATPVIRHVALMEFPSTREETICTCFSRSNLFMFILYLNAQA